MTLKIQEYLHIKTRQLRVSEESVPSALYRAPIPKYWGVGAKSLAMCSPTALN